MYNNRVAYDAEVGPQEMYDHEKTDVRCFGIGAAVTYQRMQSGVWAMAPRTWARTEATTKR